MEGLDKETCLGLFCVLFEGYWRMFRVTLHGESIACGLCFNWYDLILQ